MQVDTIPIPPAQSPDGAPLSPLDKLLIDMAELASVTSLSVRHLRRIDSSRDIPGRVVVGRQVLQTEVVREWVGRLPGREQWAALLKRNGKHETPSAGPQSPVGR